MPRPIAFSAKQKREQLQDKRAVQRGELEPSQVRYARNPAGNYRPGANHLPHPASANTAATRLISKFTSHTPEYVERSQYIAHTLPLIRPISGEAAVFKLDWMERDGGRLTCPVRPGFQMGQAKEEVERREQETFGLWLKETTAIVEEWVERGEKEGQDEGAEVSLLSPTWFETNLEVWRQLWRVSESSHILLLLADARCPVLHLPASLRSYVQGLQTRKEVIVVLTKCDLVEPEALAGWKAWVVEWWNKGGSDADASERGEIQVITVQSFEDRSKTSGPSKIVPDLPQESSKQLIEALRVAHDRLQLESPPTESLSRTSKTESPVTTDVDWEALARYSTSSRASQLPSSSSSTSDTLPPPSEDADSSSRLEPIAIGLVGQPNVGKSSLLNAILGENRVRVGRTPGKTKHFQTIFWGQKKEVKFVDCPGLVCPSLVGFELQALCGILPISQIPSLFACISTAARLAPLEQIFSVSQTKEPEQKGEYADKRTWRGTRAQERVEEEAKSKPELTAWQIIEGRAIDRGYMTAKTGRPDINRAATGMMLALAEGKVRWCFYPPGSAVNREARGIWSIDHAGTDDGRSYDDSVGPKRIHREATLGVQHGPGL